MITVEEQEPFGGPRWVRIGGQRRSLGGPLTRLVHGHVLDQPAEPDCNDAGETR